jgi:hypothetical protein
MRPARGVVPQSGCVGRTSTEPPCRAQETPTDDNNTRYHRFTHTRGVRPLLPKRRQPLIGHLMRTSDSRIPPLMRCLSCCAGPRRIPSRIRQQNIITFIHEGCGPFPSPPWPSETSRAMVNRPVNTARAGANSASDSRSRSKPATKQCDCKGGFQLQQPGDVWRCLPVSRAPPAQQSAQRKRRPPIHMSRALALARAPPWQAGLLTPVLSAASAALH